MYFNFLNMVFSPVDKNQQNFTKLESYVCCVCMEMVH